MDMLNSPPTSVASAFVRVERAFAGVQLEDGISLRQAELANNASYQRDEWWERVRQLDVADDWTKIPTKELEDLCYLAHVDPKGFRYYIPAFLLHFTRDYDPSWPHVVQVLRALTPDERSWPHHMHRYSRLSAEQKTAIAEFLVRAPKHVDLCAEDAAAIAKALRVYWGRFLP